MQRFAGDLDRTPLANGVTCYRPLDREGKLPDSPQHDRAVVGCEHQPIGLQAVDRSIL